MMLLFASKTNIMSTYYCASVGSEWEFKEHAEVGQQNKEVNKPFCKAPCSLLMVRVQGHDDTGLELPMSTLEM